ncbi:hypothetical protein BGZ74_005530, partial [Mortierella antarctica]
MGGLGAGTPEDVENMVDNNDNDDVFVSFSIGQEPAIGNDDADNSDSDTELLEDELFDGNTAGNNTSTKQALVKLRTGLKKIRISSSQLDKFKELTKTDMNKNGLVPLLNVCTHWGSTFTMLHQAIQCKAAYSDTVADDDLKEYFLNTNEWHHLTKLWDILQKFDESTTAACASTSYAAIAISIQIYNDILDHLETFFNDVEIAQSVPDLVRGARAAYKKICKYYAKTDLTPIYSVATVLHPACRFEYWENEGWGKYTEEAKKAVHDVWKAHYKPQQSTNPAQLTL